MKRAKVWILAALAAAGMIAAAPAQSTKKTLVVYFSVSGRTEGIAESIADAAGADVFEIVPSVPYTSADTNWNDDNSRTSRERVDPDRNVELVSTAVPGWDSYDTVFFGYPIWWGGAAWPVETFVKANDFTGKTVITFCTSGSSGIGRSTETLAGLAGTGDWQSGRRFRAGESSAAVAEWVRGLGLAN